MASVAANRSPSYPTARLSTSPKSWPTPAAAEDERSTGRFFLGLSAHTGPREPHQGVRQPRLRAAALQLHRRIRIQPIEVVAESHSGRECASIFTPDPATGLYFAANRVNLIRSGSLRAEQKERFRHGRRK